MNIRATLATLGNSRRKFEIQTHEQPCLIVQGRHYSNKMEKPIQSQSSCLPALFLFFCWCC